MAVKDHSLDNKIVKAAKEEFLALGYEKASLHKIAEKAGITTGALYTRYKGKDDLFCSLVKDSMSTIALNAEPVGQMYEEARKTGSAEKILDAIKAEERIYIDLLFEHYEECVLFFCKSRGSSIEIFLDRMMKEKSKTTVEFLKTIAKRDIDFDGIEMIMAEQFQYYRHVLEKNYSKEKAVSCMKTVEFFLEAGWKAIFEMIL